jgi:hypothetical protein
VVATKIANYLTEISPYELYVSSNKVAYSIIVFKDNLYLAEIFSDVEHFQKKYTRILRYNREFSSWEEIYTGSVTIDDLDDGSDSSYLICQTIVFGAEKEASSVLCVRFASISTEKLLFSKDGENFKVIGSKQQTILQLFASRRLLSWRGRTYTLPSGTSGVLKEYDRDVIYSSNTASLEQWQESNPAGFGDPSNQRIAELIVFDDRLYAGTVNVEKGFQLWQARDISQTPHNWEPVLSNGANRYSLNQTVSSMVVFKNDLYVASGLFIDISNERVKKLYPAGFELIRIYADGEWDIIVGTPKFSKDGLKVPLSAMGEGFNEPYNCVVQQMVVHGDYLYLATQKVENFQLWRTEDGETWELVSVEDSITNYSEVEVRNAFSASWGMIFVLDVAEPGGKEKVQICLADSIF